MEELIMRLEKLLKLGMEFISTSNESELAQKTNPSKWSKKEILGHLVDSGINNLQRFTEIQFEEKPFKIRKYNQEELVIANDYQHADIEVIANLWLSINHQIKNVISQQDETTLSYPIELGKNNICDLRFLMVDYVDHLEHHLNQIVGK
ncbi:DinB family protein [Reichenbachiella agarivorans]|uniref:DinB family protein n=1 Tax=Reichenbachiella agarivorans TaxID=2979464 RepID=A0ABY6CSQ8_9BACT|nr:DinB family protein [Reichenbachiella agarivorans]UXP32483.1 DinB family protein [Reichenbachiella agarivorans]